MDLQVNELSFSYESRKVLEDIQLHIKNKSFVGVIGPNGSGKSTALKNIYRALKPDYGEIKLDGIPLEKISHKESARIMGVVGQEHEMPFDFQAWEIVAMGRSPHKKLFETDSGRDQEIVKKSLEIMDMAEQSHQNYQHLSGGEKQRVLIARALAQEAEFLILDEPTSHLDVRYQLEVFQLIKEMNITVLAAIHDLNIAALFCDWIYILKDGLVYKSGTPEELFTPEIMYQVYGIHTDISTHPLTGKKNITYLPWGKIDKKADKDEEAPDYNHSLMPDRYTVS